jgi:carbon-monoxide dehydrogenase small subunit
MKGVFKVNGRACEIEFHAQDTLLTALRAGGFTEVKEGCAEGQCGACVVLLNGVLVNSCQVMAATALNRDILTVKGLGTLHHPHPIQRAFVETGAVQCGFCTPGMVLAAYSLIQQNSNPSEQEIRSALDGNLCRCTGYVKIVQAVQLAARRMAEHG